MVLIPCRKDISLNYIRVGVGGSPHHIEKENPRRDKRQKCLLGHIHLKGTMKDKWILRVLVMK